MNRSFKMEVEVTEYYELEVRTSFQNFDQREGSTYTDYKKEAHKFWAFNEAVDWVKKNPKAEVVSFVKVEDKIKALECWTAK